ncbi:MAG: hypothetical protein J5938_00840 [Clostridia bacterium]|nr:hypothetical protein [Clostridia bacterium]
MRSEAMRVFALILALFLFALCSLGCGGQAGITEDSSSSPSGENGSQTEPAATENSAIPSSQAEEVLLENEFARVTFTGVKSDSFWGVSLGFLLENVSEEFSLSFSIDRMTVNGYSESVLSYQTVSPGKKVNESVSVSDSFLERTGIASLDEVVFELTVSDSEDFLAEPFCKTVLTVHPSGAAPEDVVIPERLSYEGEQVIVDNDQLSFLILKEDPEGFWGYTMLCYAENRSNQALTISWDDVSVNGFMCDPYFSTTLRPGTRGYFDVSFLSSSFEENGITEVEEVEFTLRVRDADDWFADPIYREVETYRP